MYVNVILFLFIFNNLDFLHFTKIRAIFFKTFFKISNNLTQKRFFSPLPYCHKPTNHHPETKQ